MRKSSDCLGFLILVLINFLSFAKSENCGGVFKSNHLVVPILGSSNWIGNGEKCSYVLKSPFRCPYEYRVRFGILDEYCNLNDEFCGTFIEEKFFQTDSGILNVTISTENPISEPGFYVRINQLECKRSKANYSSSHQDQFENSVEIYIPSEVGLLIPVQKEENAKNFTKEISPEKPLEGIVISRSLITSPGFPNHVYNIINCNIIIHRKDPNTCRLRILFKFFNVQNPTENVCNFHYLQIDNRRLCGCQTGMVYETHWDNYPKVIQYVNYGIRSSVSNGFVLEVFQEACPFRFQKELDSSEGKEPTSLFQFPKQFHSGNCNFGYNDWMQLSRDYGWNYRTTCGRY